MQALVVTDGKISVTRREVPEPGFNEARICVLLAGICGTDLEVTRGYKGSNVVLGHEFVGIVDLIGQCDEQRKHSFARGDRAVAEINCVLPGVCRNAHERAHYAQRSALGIFGRDGAFANFVNVPIENLHKVPRHVTNEAAVFAEPIAAACEIVEQVHIKGTSSVAVLGAGRLGWLVAKVLQLNGNDVAMLSRVDNWERNRQLAIDFGIRLASATEGKRCYDFVVDCTGNPRGFARAVELVRPRGTIILKSTYAFTNETSGVDLTPVVVNEIRVVGSRCGPFGPALRLLSSGKIDPTILISHTYFLRDADKAFHRAAQKGVLKVLLEPEPAYD